MRGLNRIGYAGPLWVEWEDVGVDREIAAPESLEFVRRLAADPSERRFDRGVQRRRVLTLSSTSREDHTLCVELIPGRLS
jgi:hypothetical protein